VKALRHLRKPHKQNPKYVQPSDRKEPTEEQQHAPWVQRLADAVQHCEAAHHKGEGGGEAEGLVVGSQQQVLADVAQDGLAALLGLVLQSKKHIAVGWSGCEQGTF
jgi:hypothetical protein